MKIFKKILSLVLIVPIMFLLVSCKKDNSKDTGGASSGVQTLTTNEVLKFAYDSFEIDSNKEAQTGSAFASKTQNEYTFEEYDNYVFVGMKLLESISELIYVENVWCCGLKQEFISAGKVNNVSKFLVQSSIDEDVTTIDVYVAYSIAGYDAEENKRSFNLFAYRVVYNQKNKNIQVSAWIEKSLDVKNDLQEIANSTAQYYIFSYDANKILARSFTRPMNIDIQNMIMIQSVQNRKALRFNIDENLALSSSEISNDLVKTDLLKFDDLEKIVFEAEVSEGNQNSKLTNSLAKFADASEISDIVN